MFIVLGAGAPVAFVDCIGLAWAMCCYLRWASGLADMCSSIGYGLIVVLGTGVPVTVSLTVLVMRGL